MLVPQFVIACHVRHHFCNFTDLKHSIWKSGFWASISTQFSHDTSNFRSLMIPQIFGRTCIWRLAKVEGLIENLRYVKNCVEIISSKTRFNIKYLPTETNFHSKIPFVSWLDHNRSIIVKYEKETWTRGIKTWMFSAPPYSMLNGTAYPPNAGFCLPDIDHCLPSGLLNVSKCQLGMCYVTKIHIKLRKILQRLKKPKNKLAQSIQCSLWVREFASSESCQCQCSHENWVFLKFPWTKNSLLIVL